MDCVVWFLTSFAINRRWRGNQNDLRVQVSPTCQIGGWSQWCVCVWGAQERGCGAKRQLLYGKKKWNTESHRRLEIASMRWQIPATAMERSIEGATLIQKFSVMVPQWQMWCDCGGNMMPCGGHSEQLPCSAINAYSNSKRNKFECSCLASRA